MGTITLDINTEARRTQSPNICSNAMAIKNPKIHETQMPILVVLISSLSEALGLKAGLYTSYAMFPPATKQ